MEKFAFIIHPLSIHDMAHVSPVLKFIPDSWLESALKLKKPFQVSHITGAGRICYGQDHRIREDCSGTGR